MIGSVAIEKSRTIVERQGGEATPRQIAFHPGRKRVALIVVQIKPSSGRRRKIRQPARYGPEPLSLLVREHQMGVVTVENQRRADGCFQASDAGRLNGEWQEDVRIADGVVVKEILRSGVKVREG